MHSVEVPVIVFMLLLLCLLSGIRFCMLYEYRMGVQLVSNPTLAVLLTDFFGMTVPNHKACPKQKPTERDRIEIGKKCC